MKNQFELFPQPITSSHDAYSDARRKHLTGRVVCWFSCGAASAVAARLAVLEYPEAEIVYCDTLAAEHPDNARFMADCEEWIGRKFTIIRSEKYESPEDVWRKTRWLVGPAGARCTTELKKIPRRAYVPDADAIQVFGLDVDEGGRIAKFRANNPEVYAVFPLADRGLDKNDCLGILHRAGIEIPAMYRLGYRNNNCIGCVKGGSGYFNRIRKDFPEVFSKMARLEREIGAAICKTYRGGERVPVYLDELPPDAGRYEEEPAIECGIACNSAIKEMEACES